jgi:hypothetical protein
VIGGWQLNNGLNWSSGLPWTPFVGNCGPIHDTGACRPTIKGSFKTGVQGGLDPVAHTINFFTPVAPLVYPAASLTVGTDTCTLPRPTSGPFSLGACGFTGLAGRNSFRGPRHFGDDMSLTKAFKITERVNASFKIDAYNVFNHPILDFSEQDYAATGGKTIDGSGNNGKITNIEYGTNMRTLQFGLRLNF